MARKILLTVTWIVGIAAALGLGVVLGRQIRPGARPTGSWQTGLVPGHRFPSVPLLEATGETVVSDRLFASRGRIIIFVDPRCPSCAPAALRWQRLVSSGQIDVSSVAAITTASAEESRVYQVELGLTFPVYRDVYETLQNQYGVTGLPYEVIVDASGTIRATSVDTQRKIDVRQVKRQLKG